ncbi:hypothetical protein GJAV_G00093960 [Gymnothorax javanicus]|nr:hypothetical protein GJAV_G00093960 [Gymnothorax javanicus]
MMSNFVTFQTQLGAILEILAKAAMAEINRCVDDSCAVFRLEISQSQTEIETLKHKLQNLERELLETRKKKTVSVFRQQSSFKPRGRDDRTVVENVNAPSKPSITGNQPRCEVLPVKQERLAEDIFISDERLKPSAEDHVTQTIPLEDGKKPDTEPTPVRDPEELREQHRCGRGDEELSGLEFVVKAEQEGDVSQRLNQTGCELGVGRINTLDSEYVMYESDNQLWTSFTQRNSDTERDDMVCSNAAEQCSPSLSIHSPLRYTSATMEGSGETPSSSEASYAEEFATMGERPPVCSVELRSEAIHTQQAQLGSIMEILAKAAVAEINRCVDDSCAVFRLEISQSQTEIETLKHKLQILEREVMETRRQKTAIVEHSALTERVVGEEWRSRASEGEDRAAVKDVDTPLQPGICRGQLRPDHLTIKQESLDEDLWCRVKQVTSSSEEQEKPTTAKEETRRNWKKPDTEPTPVGDQEELREQHRCGHGDVELSGLEFVVKEEHVAQRLNQTESEHSAERLSNQSFEYEEYERDNQRWASCTQGDSDMESDDPMGSNAIEQYSQSLPIPSALQLAPSIMKVSGNTLSIYGASYVEEFDKMGEEPSVRSAELRSEAIHTQQGQYRVTVTESPAQPHSGSQYETGSAPSTSVVGSEKRGMSNFVTIQTQLGSVVEIIAKAAAAEINRCVDESCAVFRLEITHSQKEIEALKHKLQVLERELLKTRRQKTASSHIVVEHSHCTDKGFEQEWRFRRREGEDRTAVGDVNTHLQPCFTKDQCRSDGHPTKQERLEEVCYGDKHLRSSAEDQVTQTIRVEDEKKLDTEPTPVGDPEELRCGLGDEELSGLEFVVKAEQEEEHVAQRLNQTGCELGTGRLSNLNSEYVMYERDNQLWTSFTQANSGMESNEPVSSNATEPCSQSLSIYFPIQHTTATMEVSGNTLSSFGDSYAEEFDKMGVKPFACSEELRSEAIHTQQGQYRERLAHTVERENQTLLPQQQQHGPAVKHRKGSESPAQPHSGSQYETGSALSTSAVNAEKKGKRSHGRVKPHTDQPH